MKIIILNNSDIRIGGIKVHAAMPNGIYSILSQGGVLRDGAPYYRHNDLAYRWVAYQNWEFTHHFTGYLHVLLI